MRLLVLLFLIVASASCGQGSIADSVAAMLEKCKYAFSVCEAIDDPPDRERQCKHDFENVLKDMERADDAANKDEVNRIKHANAAKSFCESIAAKYQR